MSLEPTEDPHFALMAASSAELASQYVRADGDPWVGSPFEWILRVPSRSKGAVGERLVEEWAIQCGLDVRRSRSSDADRIINGHRVEVKLSTLWRGGSFKFQQIRDQDYDYCLCLALSPFEVNAWLLPKRVLTQYVIGHMGQHTGAGGTDTAWLGFDAGDAYDWMAPYGDRLARVEELLVSAGTGPY